MISCVEPSRVAPVWSTGVHRMAHAKRLQNHSAPSGPIAFRRAQGAATKSHQPPTDSAPKPFLIAVSQAKSQICTHFADDICRWSVLRKSPPDFAGKIRVEKPR